MKKLSTFLTVQNAVLVLVGIVALFVLVPDWLAMGAPNCQTTAAATGAVYIASFNGGSGNCTYTAIHAGQSPSQCGVWYRGSILQPGYSQPINLLDSACYAFLPGPSRLASDYAADINPSLLPTASIVCPAESPYNAIFNAHDYFALSWSAAGAATLTGSEAPVPPVNQSQNQTQNQTQNCAASMISRGIRRPCSACPMDAKLCPDGSSVGRTGANCAFAACPSQNVTQPPVQQTAGFDYVWIVAGLVVIAVAYYAWTKKVFK